MSYYLTKCSIKNSDGKIKKESYAVKADSSILAEASCSLNLVSRNLQEVSDINKKSWVDVLTNVIGGDWYEVKTEWISIDDKVCKDSYLQQEFSIDAAMQKIADLTAELNAAITSIVKTNIVDYFIGE